MGEEKPKTFEDLIISSSSSEQRKEEKNEIVEPWQDREEEHEIIEKGIEWKKRLAENREIQEQSKEVSDIEKEELLEKGQEEYEEKEQQSADEDKENQAKQEEENDLNDVLITQDEIDSLLGKEDESAAKKEEMKVEESGIVEKQKESAENLQLPMEEKFANEEQKLEEPKTSEMIKDDLAKLQEEIKNREAEKIKAKKTVGKFQNLSARLGLKGGEAKEIEKSRRSKVQIELERAGEGIKDAENEYKDLIHEYGKLLTKEGVPQGAVIEQMMKQRDQLEQEKLNQIEESKGRFMKAVDKYNKLPLKYKIAITAGMIGGGIATGMAGGSAAVAGSLALGSAKAFESIAAGVGAKSVVEHFGKKKEEKIKKKAIEEMAAELEEGKNLSDVWEEKTAKMDEQIEKSLANNKAFAKWIGVDVGIATFLLSGGHKDFANAWKVWRADKAILGAGESLMHKEAQQTAQKASEEAIGKKTGIEVEKSLENQFQKNVPIVENAKMAGQSFEEVAKKGDTVWGMMKENLAKNPEFAKMDKAKQTHILDALRRKIASDPESIGLARGADINKINIGQKLNFQKVFEDKGAMNQLFEKAKNILPNKAANIDAGIKNVAEKTIANRSYTGGGPINVAESVNAGQKAVEVLKMPAAEKLKTVQPINSLWSRLLGQSDKGFFAENLDKIGEGKSFFARQEWGRWKNMQVEKILNSSFVSEREGVRLLERSQRESFVRFLKMLRRAVPPLAGKKETVFEYLRRAQSALK